MSIGDILFTRDQINQAAREAGFVKRKPRKIDPFSLLGSLVEESLRGYQRVIVQDSTVIKLPTALFPSFSGVSNGHNPSAAVLELMDWTIFITNIAASKATFAEILGIYGLRWRIEVIFKAWKSHLKFDEVHQVSERQLRILLKTKLLIIAAASNLYRRFESILWRKYRHRLSLLKFMNYMAASMARLNRVLCPLSEEALESSSLVKALARYCCYDKRKKRRNFAETWEFLA